MRPIAQACALLLLALAACSAPRLETKPWHVSAGWHAGPYSSTAYPHVEWSVIERLHAGMSAAEARALLGDLQSYHHPANAIAFARHPPDGALYEVALKLSADGTRIEDLSYKRVES